MSAENLGCLFLSGTFIKFNSENTFFELAVVNDPDIFNTDIIGGKDGCDSGNPARLIDDITVDGKKLFDRPGGNVRNRIPVVP